MSSYTPISNQNTYVPPDQYQSGQVLQSYPPNIQHAQRINSQPSFLPFLHVWGFFNWFIMAYWGYLCVSTFRNYGYTWSLFPVFLLHILGGLIGAIAYQMIYSQFKTNTISQEKSKNPMALTLAAVIVIGIGLIDYYYIFIGIVSVVNLDTISDVAAIVLGVLAWKSVIRYAKQLKNEDVL